MSESPPDSADFDETWMRLVQVATAEWTALDHRTNEAIELLRSRHPRAAYDVSIWVLERENEHSGALGVAILSLLQLKELKRARATASRLLEVAPEDWRSHVLSSWVMMAEKKKAEAVEVAASALHLAPADAQAYAAVAHVAAQVARHAGFAQTAAERAIALDPELIDPHFTLALLRELQGDWAGAIDRYGEALQTSPGDPRALMGLAEAQRLAGRRADAGRTYQSLADAAPESDELQDVLKPETPLSVFRLLRSIAVLFFGALILMLVVAATKPTMTLLVITLVVAALTATTPVRRGIALRLKPRAMAQAKTKTSWPGRNPDFVAGLVASGCLVALLVISIASSPG